MIGLGFTFIIVPSLLVALRLWARVLGGRGLQVDDYLCMGALSIGITCSSLQLYAAFDGRLGQHQIVDEFDQPVLNEPGFIVYEKTKFAVNILSVVGLGLVKASILMFYKSIFGNVRAFRIAVWCMMGLVVAWTITYTLTNLLTCIPVTPFIEPFYGNVCMTYVIDMWLSVVGTDLVTDVGILAMPIPMVLRLQMPWRDRLAVLGMFMTGATVCAISATRIATLVQISVEFLEHYNDLTYYTSPVFYWTNIELAVAVVAACLPTLRPIFIRYFKNGNTGARSNAATKGSGYTYGSSHSRRSRKGKGDGWTEMGAELDADERTQSSHALAPMNPMPPGQIIRSVDWSVRRSAEQQV